jgi:hypothetical protein
MHVALPLAGTSQTVPQAPQLSESVSRSTQLSPHDWNPVSQAILQADALHEDLPCSGVGHAVPQLPQCAAELVVSTHAALQFVSFPAHMSEHWLLEQTWPAGQAVPHAPQCDGSLEVSTHAPLQLVNGVSQVTPQALATQVSVPPPVPPHFCPHAPQLSTSVVVSTQRAPQEV